MEGSNATGPQESPDRAEGRREGRRKASDWEFVYEVDPGAPTGDPQGVCFTVVHEMVPDPSPL